ncbi:MAG TPA: TolC family protein, partial [Spirochaetales bacterium]|nr:TolC family protein [Spirochaetales bacterium]
EETRLSDAVASVSIAIHSAIRRYQGAARAIELARQSLSLAADGLALANLRAELGQAPASEVMDAELERAAQELALVDACEQLLTLERELERLLDFYPGQLVWFIKEVTK